jgi:2-polyprenyl-3-methyl-5-hydroxy-6-metoxy-1,4-benzoquinol methylase
MTSDAQFYEQLTSAEGIGRGTSVTTEHILDLSRRNGVKPHGTWLDVGCGSGHLLSKVQKAGFTALGVEPGGWGQIAAERKKLNITQGFLSYNTFPKNYNIVSATDVVEHIPNPVEFIKLLAGYVEPNGHLIITIPFADSLEAKLMGVRWNMVEPPTHCQFFFMRSLKLALQDAGMEMVDSKQYNLRNMRGLSRYRNLRRILDALVPGPQLVCLAQKINFNSVSRKQTNYINKVD